MLNTVSESVFSRSAHFLLELLQNAEDAGPKSNPGKGEIKFSVSQSRIKVSHNGVPFTEANVDAICGVRSTKKPELGTLGFLGIGFKSVFKITDCPEIHSGGFHFKFDKAAYKEPGEMPWQIIPIWADSPAETTDPTLTTFILPFRSVALHDQTLSELARACPKSRDFPIQIRKRSGGDGQNKILSFMAPEQCVGGVWRTHPVCDCICEGIPG